MNCSRLSNIIRVARLIPYLDDDSLNEFKLCLIKNCDCQDEISFMQWCLTLVEANQQESLNSDNDENSANTNGISQPIKNTDVNAVNAANINDIHSNIDQLKRYLFDMIDVTDESSFLCKILVLVLGYELTDDALIAILNEIISLAQMGKCKNNKNEAAFEQMRKDSISYNDLLSRLASNVIDYIGVFLDKEQSIELGYLNRQLFIETQKSSYIIMRNQLYHEQTIVNKYSMKYFLKHKCLPFAYSFPTLLTIMFHDWRYGHDDSESAQCIESLKQWKPIFESKWFKMLFKYVTDFQCADTIFLPYIPIDILFKQTLTDFKNNFIDRFGLLGSNIKSTRDAENIALFCENYKKYFTSQCQSNISNIKRIGTLSFNLIYDRNDDISDFDFTNEMAINSMHSDSLKPIKLRGVSNLCQALSPNYQKLEFDLANMSIYGWNELSKIFHYRLESITLHGNNWHDQSFITVKSDIINTNGDNNNNNDDQIDIDCEKLKYISFENLILLNKCLGYYKYLIENFGKYAMLENVQKFRLSLNKEEMFGRMITFIAPQEVENGFRPLLVDEVSDALLGIFSGNVYPSLETIELILDDDRYLHGFGLILSMLAENKSKLLTNSKINEIQFKFAIDIVENPYGNDRNSGDDDDRDHSSDNNNNDHSDGDDSNGDNNGDSSDDDSDDSRGDSSGDSSGDNSEGNSDASGYDDNIDDIVARYRGIDNEWFYFPKGFSIDDFDSVFMSQPSQAQEKSMIMQQNVKVSP